MTGKLRHLLSALLLLAMVAVPVRVFAQGYKLDAKLEPAQARVGEMVVYVLTVTYETKAPPQPTPPKFDQSWGFTDPKLVATSAQTQINNGVVQQSVEYRFTFQVSHEGTFKIPGTGFDLDQNPYRSNPVTLTVSKAEAPPVPQELQGRVAPPQVPGSSDLANKLNGGVFVLPSYDTAQPYVGQQVLLTYHLCIDQNKLVSAGLRADSLSADQVSVPDLQQFLKDEVFQIPKQLQFKERDMGGTKYAVAPLYQVAITPTKTGKLSVDPFQISLQFAARGRTNTRDPFFGNDPFGDDPFFTMNPFASRIQVIAMSPRLDFAVKPLPLAGKPQDFSGAVGDFKMTASLDKQNATADEDVVRLQVKVEGRGDASSLNKPKLPNVPGITVLEEPKTSSEHRKENDTLISTKTFDYVLRPTKPGKIEIPPISYTEFNPTNDQYATVQTQPMGLDVAPGTGKQMALVAPSGPQPANGGASAERKRPTQQDLNYIHVGALQAAPTGMLTGNGPMFLVALICPPLILLAGYLIGRRRTAYATNRGYYREILAGDVARKHLRKAAKLLKNDDRAGFFEELARAIRGFFGDRFHIEPSHLTIEEIETELDAKGADPELKNTTRRLLDQCDLARYAPVHPEPAVMQRAYNEAAQLLTRAEKIR